MIAVIGLGRMGLAMALRLRGDCAVPVLGFDRSEQRRDAATAAGMPLADSVAEVARRSSHVVLSLPGPAEVTSVVAGGEGLAANLQPGSGIIDTTTTDAGTAREFGHLCAQRQIHFVDAPVSGGVEAATTGSLTAMVGATEAGFDHSRQLIETLASRVVRMGDVGSGQAMKACHQLLAFGEVALLAEALAAGTRSGLDVPAMLDALEGSSASSPILTTYAKKMTGPKAERVGYPVRLALKDLTLYMDLANGAGLPSPVGGAIRALFLTAADAGLGETDASVVAQVVNEGELPPRDDLPHRGSTDR